MGALLAVVALAIAVPAAAPPVRATSLPRAAVVGAPWQVSLRAPAAPTIVASGPGTLRAPARGAKGAFRATLRFPIAGTWRIAARLGGRTTPLGSVSVDVARDALLADPFTLAVGDAGSLVVGQRDTGPLLRVAGGRASVLAPGTSAYGVTVAGGAVYAAAADGAVYRVEGSSAVRVTPALDAGAVAVDAGGNVYVTVYAGWVKRVTPAGAVTTIAGTGAEGFSGDGGPATAAALFHPHALALGPDGALYVADSENRRLRRIDLRTGTITSFGGDVGLTVSVSVAPDGTVWSADVPRDGVGGGVTRTTAQGVTTRVLARPTVNCVAVGGDGAVYVNQWEDKRIGRLDPATGKVVPVARG